MQAQYEGVEEKLGESADKFNIDLDNIDIEEPDEEQRIDLEDLPKEIQEHIKFVENHPLPQTVEQYRRCAHAFLEDTFYEKKECCIRTRISFSNSFLVSYTSGSKIAEGLSRIS